MIKSVIPNAAVKRMPFILTVLAGLFALTCLPVAKAQQNGAVSPQERWVADIPLEESLVVATDLGFSFDSPSGRIIVLFATTDAPSSAIRSYYRAILPPLGWQGSGDVFRRGPEEVAIKQVNVNGLGLWRIALQPAR